MGEPTSFIYNPLDYAWEIHQQYLQLAGQGKKKVVMLGMNPGPFGMAQTGVPFGEISAVRDWMGLKGKSKNQTRSIRSVRWKGWLVARVRSADGDCGVYFRRNFRMRRISLRIILWPIIVPWFSWKSGRNRTPDKLAASEKKPLEEVCDQHLREIVDILEPEWLIGVGGFAKKRAEEVLKGMEIKIGTILHPSPASPAANRGWAEAATKQLKEQEIWI